MFLASHNLVEILCDIGICNSSFHGTFTMDPTSGLVLESYFYATIKRPKNRTSTWLQRPMWYHSFVESSP
jgi:hypothetical protein